MSSAIVPSKEAQSTVKMYLEKAKPAMAAVLPKHLNPERLIKVALIATSKTPALLECAPETILGSVMQAADLGLEPNTALGLSYLVPFFNNKTGRKECQLIPGYRGLARLAVQSGEVKSFHARAIHAKDQWSIEYGTKPGIEHVPYVGTDDPGDLVAVYSVAEFKAGGVDFEFMTVAEVEKIRSRSKSKNNGPWVTDYEEMCKKTVIRRHAKSLPLSTENLARASAHDERAAMGEAPDFSDVGDVLGQIGVTTIDAEPEARPTGTAALKEELAKKAPEKVGASAQAGLGI